MTNATITRPMGGKKKEGSLRVSRIAGNTVIYLILSIMAVVWLLPVIWLLLQSFSGEGGQSGMTEFVPSVWSFDNYILLATNRVITKAGILGNSNYIFFFRIDAQKGFMMGSFLWTLIIAVLVAIISTLLTLATSYAFSRLRFKGRQMMMRIILILGMFPGFIGLIALYQIFSLIGLTLTKVI